MNDYIGHRFCSSKFHERDRLYRIAQDCLATAPLEGELPFSSQSLGNVVDPNLITTVCEEFDHVKGLK